MNLPAEMRRYTLAWQELLGLSKVAAELLDAGDEEAFDAAWVKRRKSYKRLMALRRRLTPALDDWPQASEGLSPDELSQAQAGITAIRAAGQELRQLDADLARGLRGLREETLAGLKRLQAGSKVMAAYGRTGAVASGPSHLSRSG